MKDETAKNARDGAAKPAPRKDALKSALRENLHRRKAQARARAADAEPSGDEGTPGSDG